MHAGQMDRDPYWSRPWPSAVALAKLVLQQPSIVRGRRVCEVGAGLGIASIAAAMAGTGLPKHDATIPAHQPLVFEGYL